MGKFRIFPENRLSTYRVNAKIKVKNTKEEILELDLLKTWFEILSKF